MLRGPGGGGGGPAAALGLPLFLLLLALLLLARAGTAAASPLLDPREALNPRLRATCHKHHPATTALDDWQLSWDKKPGRHPREYLRDYEGRPDKPFGRDVALWDKAFLEGEQAGAGAAAGAGVSVGAGEYRTEPEVAAGDRRRPTVITFFYPSEEPGFERRPLDDYMGRFELLAAAGEQMVVYVPPAVGDEIRRRRIREGDPTFVLVERWRSIWDFPTNALQRDNFRRVLPGLAAEFVAPKDNAEFHHPHLNAAYNVKAFLMYDAVLRNLFGTELFAFEDFGILRDGPSDAAGRPWGMFMDPFLSPAKLRRSVGLPGDGGVVVGEYAERVAKTPYGDKCWSTPSLIYRCKYFPAGVVLGTRVGMLEYATKYMMTVDLMEANGFYWGREEYVMAFLAVSYPYTIYSVPRYQSSPGVAWPERRTDTAKKGWPGQDPNFKEPEVLPGPEIPLFPMRTCHSGFGGPRFVSPVHDPMAAYLCPPGTHRRRQPDLELNQDPILTPAERLTAPPAPARR